MRPTRDAGPVGDDGGDRLGVHARQDQGALALEGRELGLELPQLRPGSAARSASVRLGGGRPVAVRPLAARAPAAGRCCSAGGAGGLLQAAPGPLDRGLRRRAVARAGPGSAATTPFSASQRAFEPGQALLLGGELLAGRALALRGVDADGGLAADDVELGLQAPRCGGGSPPPPAGTACWLMATRAQAVSSRLTALSGQLAGRDVAVREPHGGLQGLVEDLDLVVLLQGGGDAAHHQDRLLLARLVDLDDLEAAGQGRVLLDVLLVLGPGGGGDGAQRAAGQGGLEQVGGVAGAGGAAGADQGVGLVDEQDDGLGRGLDLLDHLAQAVLELALHAGAGLQQADVEGAQRHVLERRRHVARGDALGEALDDGGLADAGLAGEDGVVLAAAHEDVDDLADLLVAPDDGVDLALAGLLGQIDGEPLERLLLAHLRPGPWRRWPRPGPRRRPGGSRRWRASGPPGEPATISAKWSVRVSVT